MVDRTGTCKLIDLGLSHLVQLPAAVDPASTPTPAGLLLNLPPLPSYGKQPYVSPEVVFHGHPPDPFASDVWSLGILLHVLLTGRPIYASPTDPAFYHLSQGNLTSVLASYQAHGLPTLPLPAQNLLGSMLQPDATLRATLEEVRAHPWVVGLGS